MYVIDLWNKFLVSNLLWKKRFFCYVVLHWVLTLMGVCFSKSGLRVHSASTHYYLPPAQRSCFGCYTTLYIESPSKKKILLSVSGCIVLWLLMKISLNIFDFAAASHTKIQSLWMGQLLHAVLHIDANNFFWYRPLCSTTSLLLSDRFFFNWKPIWTRLRNEPELIYVYWKAIK